ncbi:MAG: tol-pal system YbgF family protein [Kofleriaceae bacterium]
MRRGLVVGLVCAATAARADQQTSLDHYESGRRAYGAAQFETAIAEFERAYQEFPAPEYLHDLGQAHRRLNQCRTAIDYFERYLQAMPKPSNRAQTEALIASLEATCPADQPSSTEPSPVDPAPPNETAAASSSADPAPPNETAAASSSADDPRAPALTRVASITKSQPRSTPTGPTISTTTNRRSPSPYSVSVGAGIVRLRAGKVIMPAVGQVEAAIRRRIGHHGDLHLGGGLTLARIPYEDMASGTAWLGGPIITADATTTLSSHLAVMIGVGVGLDLFGGLDGGNPFVMNNQPSGVVVLPRVRGELGVVWRFTDDVALRVTPVAYQRSHRSRTLAPDIGSLHGFSMSGALVVGI